MVPVINQDTPANKSAIVCRFNQIENLTVAMVYLIIPTNISTTILVMF